jgi:predicted transcriptional regulator
MERVLRSTTKEGKERKMSREEMQEDTRRLVQEMRHHAVLKFAKEQNFPASLVRCLLNLLLSGENFKLKDVEGMVKAMRKFGHSREEVLAVCERWRVLLDAEGHVAAYDRD